MPPPSDAVNLALNTAVHSAFIIWMKETWKKFSKRPFEVVTARSVSTLKDYTYKEGTPIYPFGLCAIAGSQLDTDRGGFSKRFQDIEIGRDIQGRLARLMRALPVKVGIGFQFRSDDMSDAYSFITMLYSNAPGPILNLQMRNGFVFQCKVTFPPDMDFPIESQDDGQQVRIDLAVTISSWVGQFTDVGLIRELTFRMIDDVEPQYKLEYDEADGSWHSRILLEKEITQMSSYDTTAWEYKYES